jgi:hypothetical protein
MLTFVGPLVVFASLVPAHPATATSTAGSMTGSNDSRLNLLIKFIIAPVSWNVSIHIVD